MVKKMKMKAYSSVEQINLNKWQQMVKLAITADTVQ